LELGGKSPLVIAEDADVDKAVEIASFAVFGNNGEQCDAGSRTFVHESMYDEFVKKAVAKANSMVVGDPMNMKTELGPLVDKAQYKKVLEYIEIGKKDGATFECGGKTDDLPKEGYFVRPTVFSGVTDDMRIAKEEIFGPVQSIIKYKDFEDVLKRANNTPYGLASGIVTNSMTKAFKYSSNIKAGFVWVNCWFQMFPEVEFGGHKQSGFGKDGGEGSMSEWTVTKAVVYNHSE
jgi:acyl-CoA reductase-like NAD-dependent aldehyde dehydrogenase